MCMGAQACASGLVWILCQLLLLYLITIYWWKKELILYQLQCCMWRAHVQRKYLVWSIHNNCRQNHNQSLEENPQICVGLALLDDRKPQNDNRHLYILWQTSQYILGSSFILSKNTYHSFAVYEKAIPNGKENSELSYCSVLYTSISLYFTLFLG